MATWGIADWEPHWLPGGEQLRQQAAALRSLVGTRVETTWGVWDLDQDAWFEDMPVVLCFDDGRQLEVCWQKFDDLSITWGTVDLEAAPAGFGSWRLQWRRGAHSVLASIEGGRVTDVQSTSHLFRTFSEDGKESSEWLIGGLIVHTDLGPLHIFNKLDANDLSLDPVVEGPDLRVYDL